MIGDYFRDALYVALIGQDYGKLELGFDIWQRLSLITPPTSNVCETGS